MARSWLHRELDDHFSEGAIKSTCCIWGYFKKSGKAEGYEWWEVRLVNWAGARPMMTLYTIIITMTLAVARVEKNVANPMFLFII